MAFWNRNKDKDDQEQSIDADAADQAAEAVEDSVDDVEEAVDPNATAETLAEDASEDAAAAEEAATEDVAAENPAKEDVEETASEAAEDATVVMTPEEGGETASDTALATTDSTELAETGEASGEAVDEEHPFARHDVTSKKETAKKVAKIAGIVVAAALVVTYGVGCYYFHDHFGFKTTINDVDCSFKTVEEVTELVQDQVANYELTIVEREDGSETIVGSDIDLTYVEDGQIEQMLKDQNMFKWPIALFVDREANELHASVSYDEDALAEQIAALDCMQDKNMKKPKDSYAEFDGASWVAHPEYLGTTLDKDATTVAITGAVEGTLSTLTLEDAGVYSNPEITSTNEDLLSRIRVYNDTIPFAITYHFGDKTDSVPPETMMSWIIFNEDGSWYLDEDAIRNWLHEFGLRHDTIGVARHFTGADGEEYDVEGGTYGWSTDETSEFYAIIDAFNNHESIDREPAWAQSAASFNQADWGNTYIDLNLTKQHVWIVIDGEIVFESDVVTGLPIPSRITSSGVWSILDMRSPYTMRGDIMPNGEPEYVTDCSYWMRMTWTGMGFHDATWQPWFGGDRYTYAGSHGCINMPYSAAQEMYSIVWVGMPVVSHY